jgi:membrane protease subunit HflC
MFLEALQSLTGFFVVVYEGQHALLFQLGRAKHVVGPGVHLKWPIIQTYRIQDTRHTTLDLEPQVIQLSDDLVYEVDCKVVYQITDVKKAVIEIDNLQEGLRNRVVMAVQRVVRAQDRGSVRDTDQLVADIQVELATIEQAWGVQIHQFGFSNISPSPATLEITQLDLLAKERLRLYEVCRDQGLSEEASVGLISGAIIALDGAPELPRGRGRGPTDREAAYMAQVAEAQAAERKHGPAAEQVPGKAKED